MNKGLIFSLGVALGLGGGGLIANTILKQKYEQKADEEITACRNAFLNELEKRREEKQKEVKEAAIEAAKTYSAEPEKAAEVFKQKDKQDLKEPYEITEEIFDDPSNPYKSKGLLYFPNEGIVLRDDQTIMNMDDLKATIGADALMKFDDGIDRVIIRNETFKTDYEVCLSNISYNEWKKKHPASGK